jgi:hypothetical protein
MEIALSMPKKKNRVIQIGFNKTGTSSLGKFFTQNKYSVIGSRRTDEIWANLQASKPAFTGIEFDLAQDLENHAEGIYISRYFKDLYESYPNYLFILTTRSCEKWIQSRLLHHGGRYVRRAMEHTCIHDLDQLCNHWRAEFYQYHLDVTRFFENKTNFYIHSLETIDVKGLVEFLGNDFKFENLNYPRVITGGSAKPKYSLRAN